MYEWMRRRRSAGDSGVDSRSSPSIGCLEGSPETKSECLKEYMQLGQLGVNNLAYRSRNASLLSNGSGHETSTSSWPSLSPLFPTALRAPLFRASSSLTYCCSACCAICLACAFDNVFPGEALKTMTRSTLGGIPKTIYLQNVFPLMSIGYKNEAREGKGKGWLVPNLNWLLERL